MNKTKETKYNDNVITYSKIATILFMALVFVADVTSYFSAKYICYCWVNRFDDLAVGIITAAIVMGTTIGLFVLANVYRLLNNMSRDIVFDRSNTRIMRLIFWGLVAASVAAFAGTIVWIDSLFIGVLALFVAIIVLAVKVCFDKAIAMKEDLDLTI